MVTDRRAVFAILTAAALLLWPAVWNGYPIVFADTGTYLSQAIHRYAGWDRPVFYSLFMLPLHLTITVWPVVIVQAIVTAWILWLVCRVMVSRMSSVMFIGGIAMLSLGTWLPWIVSELMPDVFTPLLILVSCLLAWVPDRLSGREQVCLAFSATFMIASQQSSLPLAFLLLPLLGALARCRRVALRHVNLPGLTGTGGSGWSDHVAGPRRRAALIVLPPALAVFALCTVNLAAHGRFAISPFGNIFLLARVIYDGPGMAVLRRDCPLEQWRLCPFLDRFPPTPDDFLWAADSPLNSAGGAKAVSQEANAIIEAALVADPVAEARAVIANALAQLSLFASGDGLTPWPREVSPWIEQDFAGREVAAYESARQQSGTLSVSRTWSDVHKVTALAGLAICTLLLPFTVRRRAPSLGFLLAIMIALPASAAITGGLSAPHARYQSRIMWLPPFVAFVSAASLRSSTTGRYHA